MAIATFSLVALDCPDPLELARFYADITGWEIDITFVDDADTPRWVQLVAPTGPTIAFQRIPDHREPTWPGGDRPQQLHLDFDVPDLDEGEAAVLAIGARKTETQPYPDSFRVYLDPIGHPFCLVKA